MIAVAGLGILVLYISPAIIQLSETYYSPASIHIDAKPPEEKILPDRQIIDGYDLSRPPPD